MNSSVLVNRPHASPGLANAVFCQVARMVRGCNAWRYMARRPATHSTGSAMIRQVTEPGPYSPWVAGSAIVTSVLLLRAGLLGDPVQVARRPGDDRHSDDLGLVVAV